MENGLSIYYPGNTVIAPNPGRKRREKVINPDKVPDFEGKVMQPSPKVCAVTKCVWCGGTAGGQYFITCSRCSNCQYCGMIDSVDPYRCFICGNYLPEELRTPVVKYNAAELEQSE
jgi:hypothetical protein